MSQPHRIPRTCFIRWAELTAWLREEGISVRQVKRMLADGRIVRYRLRPNERAMYSVRQVYQAVWRLDLKTPASCRTPKI